MKRIYLLCTLFTLLCGGVAVSREAVTPTILWSFDTACGIQSSSVSVSPDGNIIVGTNIGNKATENLYVLSPSGEKKASYYAPSHIRSTAAVADDNSYYIGSYANTFLSFGNTLSCSPTAKFEGLGNVKFNAPALDEDGTIYSPQHGFLYSMTSEGYRLKVNWMVDLKIEDIYSAPIVDKKSVYIAQSRGYLFSINKKSGKVNWKRRYGVGCSNMVAMGEDGTIFLCGNSTTGAYVAAVNPANGRARWRVDIPGDEFNNSGVSLSRDNLYVGSSRGVMRCYSQSNGELQWQYTTARGGEIRSTAAIDNNGDIYFGDYDGYLHILKANGLRCCEAMKLGSQIFSSPAIGSDGVVYICVNQYEGNKPEDRPAKVYAIKSSATSAMKTWSMMGGDAQRTGRKK